MRTGANFPGIGNFNEKVVLHAIRQSRGISQTELVARTGLATQTVSVIVNQLLAKGEARVSGLQSVGRGRPRTILELVPGARLSIGIHVDPSVVTTVILDLAGQVVASAHSQEVLAEGPEGATAATATLVHELIKDSGVDADRILGGCLATPGAVDSRNGCMLQPLWMPAWDRFPLRERMAAHLGMPVDFVKDTLAAVTGETWLRADAADDTSMVFMYIGTGTGVGVSINGEAAGGSSGNGGEIGRLLVNLGENDTGDAFAGRGMDNDPAILVRRAIQSGTLSGSLDSTRTLAGIDAGFRRLCRRAANGDEAARDILTAAGRRVASAAAVVAEIIDADDVVLGGPYWGLVEEFYFPECVRALAEPSGDIRHPVRVTGSSMGHDVGAIGAAARVLDGHYTPRASTLATDEH